MGRQLKRVPLDFDWPMQQVWWGYLSPYVDESAGGGSYRAAMEYVEKHWEPTEPPTGDGFQLWETTSEGSPISPVFSSLDELCAWAEDGATTFGSAKTSASDWKRMLSGDFVHYDAGNGMVFI